MQSTWASPAKGKCSSPCWSFLLPNIQDAPKPALRFLYQLYGCIISHPVLAEPQGHMSTNAVCSLALIRPVLSSISWSTLLLCIGFSWPQGGTTTHKLPGSGLAGHKQRRQQQVQRSRILHGG